jgi:hypothetical protein
LRKRSKILTVPQFGGRVPIVRLFVENDPRLQNDLISAMRM